MPNLKEDYPHNIPFQQDAASVSIYFTFQFGTFCFENFNGST